MGILSWILFGLVVGVVAKFLMPGDDPGGVIVTILLGVAGAFVGGFIGTQLGWGSVGTWDLRSFGLSIGGAMLLLIGYRLIRGRRA